MHDLCREYRAEGVPDLVVETTHEDVRYERSRSAAADAAAGRAILDASDGYLETLAVYRKVAEAMPAFDTMLVHGSCVAVDGEAYLLCAPSGTGKSTHARLWRELLGERAVMVNDDKPLVRAEGCSAVAFGTPWDGKHHLSNNVTVPLRAVCLLERAEDNQIRRLEAAEAYPRVLRHVYRPRGHRALALTIGLVDGLLSSVDLWSLGCNMDIEAAELSYSAMSGRSMS